MGSRKCAAKKNRRWRVRPLTLSWAAREWRRLLAAACGISLAAGVWYGVPRVLQLIITHRYFALTNIELDGNRRITRSELLHWAGIDESTSVWQVPPDRVRMRLRAHPWIQRANVGREFPNRLKIEVTERRPVAMVRLGELNYVDRSGRILGRLHAGDSPDFPVITGLEDLESSGFMPVAVHRALRFLRLCERMSCFDAISEIHVDVDRGITVFPLRTAVAVVLGWGSWREKLARSARVFAAWEGQAGRLAAVDVSFRGIVVVKLHEERCPAAVRSKKAMRV